MYTISSPDSSPPQKKELCWRTKIHWEGREMGHCRGLQDLNFRIN